MAYVQADKERASLSVLSRQKVHILVSWSQKETRWTSKRVYQGLCKFLSCLTKTSWWVFNEISKKIQQWKINHDGEQCPDILFADGQRNNRGTIRQAKPSDTSLKDRMNLKVLSGNIDMPKTRLHWIFKQVYLKQHSLLKPKLTAGNMDWGCNFAWSKIGWSVF